MEDQEEEFFTQAPADQIIVKQPPSSIRDLDFVEDLIYKNLAF